MNEDKTPGPSPFDDFLRKLLEDEAVEETNCVVCAQGFDLSQLPEGSSGPVAMKATVNQFQFFMDPTTGPVNRGFVTSSAYQQVCTKGDPAPSATQADRARTAMMVVDLWLDTASDFTPGGVKRKVWT